jgi:hypothetical protein
MIPSFKLHKTKNFNLPKILSDINLENPNSGYSYIISKLFHSFEIELAGDPLENTIFKYSKNQSLDEIYIKKSFIIGVINLEILTEFNMPVVCVSVVKESEFNKINL